MRRATILLILLSAGLALTAQAAELDTTMHAMPKPGLPTPACPSCPPADADEDALKHDRAMPEFAGAKRDESGRFEAGAGAVDGGVVLINVGGLLQVSTP